MHSPKSTVALSVSTEHKTSPALKDAPSATFQADIVPDSIVGDKLGMPTTSCGGYEANHLSPENRCELYDGTARKRETFDDVCMDERVAARVKRVFAADIAMVLKETEGGRRTKGVW